MKESPELSFHVTNVEVKKASSLVFEEEDANISLPNSHIFDPQHSRA